MAHILFLFLLDVLSYFYFLIFLCSMNEKYWGRRKGRGEVHKGVMCAVTKEQNDCNFTGNLISFFCFCFSLITHFIVQHAVFTFFPPYIFLRFVNRNKDMEFVID